VLKAANQYVPFELPVSQGHQHLREPYSEGVPCELTLAPHDVFKTAYVCFWCQDNRRNRQPFNLR